MMANYHGDALVTMHTVQELCMALLGCQSPTYGQRLSVLSVNQRGENYWHQPSIYNLPIYR